MNKQVRSSQSAEPLPRVGFQEQLLSAVHSLKNRVPRGMNTGARSSQEQLLSRKAVADRWQTSIETVKRREKAGLLKAIRFNQRLLRYKLSDIEALEAAAS